MSETQPASLVDFNTIDFEVRIISDSMRARNNYDKLALLDFNEAIKLNAALYKAYDARGSLYRDDFGKCSNYRFGSGRRAAAVLW
jgi:hypothetical protein